MRNAFEDISFDDTAQAGEHLDMVLGTAGPELEKNLAVALMETSHPSKALLGLVRFLERHAAPEEERARMAESLRYTRLMCTVLSQSHFLTDVLCRHPEYAAWLATDAPLTSERDSGEMVEELWEEVRSCDSLERCGYILRQFQRREVLRIATREIFSHASIASSTRDLSNLADAMVEVAYRVVDEGLRERFGEPAYRDEEGNTHTSTFVVMGLGKLGGRELNFSSDIDPIFLYSHEGETTGGRSEPVSNGEYFQKLGERLIRVLSEQTPDGIIFRVDMRLRPYGRLSPLAIGLDNAVDYYGDYAQAWERQALIKARPIAGDAQLGEDFIARTRPIVFPRYFDDETLEEIRGIKQQIDLQAAERGMSGTDVKLGKGGIRDIEFTVQLLQLLNAGRMPALRTSSTLEAIKALGAHGHLTAFEATTLSSNYCFLRQVEHRLQIEGNQQRHNLPQEGPEMDELARRLGYASGESFMREHGERTAATRAILERFFSTEGAGNLWTYDLLSFYTDGHVGLARLRQYGFQDPEKARIELQGLSAGSREAPYPFHVRQQFAKIVPMLLEAISAWSDPDGLLLRLGRVIANVRAPGSLYSILGAQPSLCEYLVTLVANSDYLSEILIRDPGLFDVIGNRRAMEEPLPRAELEQQLEALSHAADSDAALYRLRDGEMLRIGLRELLAGASVAEVGEELSQLAEVCLAHALSNARRATIDRYGECAGQFAVLGLGKLGGREMSYGSDLDLLFVYEAGEAEAGQMGAAEYFAAVAAHAIRTLKEPTRYGRLYDVDARLRPDGNKGMLTVSRRRLIEYYMEEAQPWERLVLMKVRSVGGDMAFGEAVTTEIREAGLGRLLTAEELTQVEDLRQRLAKGASPRDVKKREGGIAALEFAVRVLQIQHGTATPALNRPDVLGAIEVLEGAGHLAADEGGCLREAYTMFRRIENRVRMMNGRAESLLPESEEALKDLAKRLGIEGDLRALIEAKAKAVHDLYLAILERSAQ